MIKRRTCEIKLGLERKRIKVRESRVTVACMSGSPLWFGSSRGWGWEIMFMVVLHGHAGMVGEIQSGPMVVFRGLALAEEKGGEMREDSWVSGVWGSLATAATSWVSCFVRASTRSRWRT